MKNRIRDDITCARASSDCRGKKSKFNGTDERSGRLIACAKLGHILVGETKALQETCKEDWLTLCLSKGIKV